MAYGTVARAGHALAGEFCDEIMNQRLEKLSHDSFMAKHVKEKIREKISSEQEIYSTAVGIIKKERKQSIRARLEARLDARMAGVIAPSDAQMPFTVSHFPSIMSLA